MDQTNLQRASRWLFPPRCLVCDEAGDAHLDLCAACHEDLPDLRSACPACALPLGLADAGTRCGQCMGSTTSLTEVRAAFLYQWPVDALLRRFKFQADLAAGRLLSQLMAARLEERSAAGLIVPVPLHAKRIRERGYDQAAELARPLARALGHPFRRLLRRRIATLPQSELDAEARRRNVRAAFECVAPAPDYVVLVDDVMTTGATLRAAAWALRRAGASRVDAWVCARVP